MIKIGLCGYGKMGQEIEKLCIDTNKYEITGIITSKSSSETLEELCKNSSIIIDFSNPIIIPTLLKFSLKYQTKILIGTTSLKDSDFNLLKNAAEKISIFYSANTSIGANLLALLAAKASLILGNDFDTDIIDIHHRDKKDAPSGTALMIGKHIEQNSKHTNINYSSIRAGGIYGKHTAYFASKDEVLSISHEALNRATFARGALIIAEWLINKPAGYYKINDMLDFVI